MRDEWFLAAVCFLASAELAFGDDRLDHKEINPRKLEEAFSEDDEIESDEDLPIHERGPLRGRRQLDLSKLDMSDPLSVTAASKAGQSIMVFVDIRGDPTEGERDQITLFWEANLLNAHSIEAKRFMIKSDRVIFQLDRGENIIELAAVLRREDRCFSFEVESVYFLCPGHPQWDPKNPSATRKSLKDEGKWKDNDWRPEGWKERLEYTMDTEDKLAPKKKSNFKWKKSVKTEL